MNTKIDIKNEEAKEPEPFQYTDYRSFLNDLYLWKKSTNPNFSHRYFAQKAGLGSPNYLKLVMDSTRNLSQKSIEPFILGLGLKGTKAEYFRNLVWFNQSSTPSERNTYYEKLLRLKPNSGAKKMEQGLHEFYSNWKILALHQMIGLKGFRKESSWIAKRLAISEKEAKEAMDLLIGLGMVKRTANGYQSVEHNISTGDEVRSLNVKNFHRQMIGKAMDSLENLPAARRDISSLTIPVRRADFIRVKEQIQLFRKELMRLQAQPNEGEEVVQINIQLFPLVSALDDGELK